MLLVPQTLKRSKRNTTNLSSIINSATQMKQTNYLKDTNYQNSQKKKYREQITTNCTPEMQG